MRKRRILLALALALGLTGAASALPVVPDAPQRSSWGRDVVALFVPADAEADAYFHLSNAQHGCQTTMAPFADAWFAQNGYGHLIVNTSGPWYHKYSDGTMVVHAVFKSNANYGQMEIRCHMAGPDESPSVLFHDGWPMWTFYGRESYPYTPCNGGYVLGTAYCLRDGGFS